MKILLACDHGGFALKEKISSFLKKQNLTFEDLGVFSADSVDYPDLASQVATEVSLKKADRGILVCGTGIGMSIAANKFKGVRSASVFDTETAKLSREHNDLNILCLGGRILDEKLACEITQLFLSTPFSGDRHTRRIEKIKQIEEKNFK